jgi:hypothetical protein
MNETRQETLPQGREAVAALAASGQTIKAYCDSTGQSEWTLRRWRAEYGEALGVPIIRRPGTLNARGRAKVRAKQAGSTATTLVPIMVAQTRTQSAELSVEIRLRGERTVVVCAGVDCGLLSRLIGAVERAV